MFNDYIYVMSEVGNIHGRYIAHIADAVASVAEPFIAVSSIYESAEEWTVIRAESRTRGISDDVLRDYHAAATPISSIRQIIARDYK